ncbi:MAG: hypothetical protein ABW318_02730 [Vicinamibacterales bacterium]
MLASAPVGTSAKMWVSQSDATAAQLRLQSPVLFAHEVDDIALLLLEPSEERHEEEMESA